MGKGAMPIFCTIPGYNISKYNNYQYDSGATHYLHHTEFYDKMQTNLNSAIKSINEHITAINRRNGMATPHLHSDITQHRGKKRRYYITKWECLYDGVHGTDTTKHLWAGTISRAIEINRSRNDSDSDQASPKRSWRREKRQRLT